MMRQPALVFAWALSACSMPQNEHPAKLATNAETPLPRLSSADLAEVSSGSLVVQKSVVFRADKKYVGGLAFLSVRASPETVLGEIFSTKAALEWMPQTLSATAVAGEASDLRVRFEQGEKPFVATYTLHIWRDDLAIRWVLDPSYPHDIEDCWGFLGVTPFDETHSLVTLGVMIDLGDGVVRAFAEPDIQNTVLGTPEAIRSYVERQPYSAEHATL